MAKRTKEKPDVKTQPDSICRYTPTFRREAANYLLAHCGSGDLTLEFGQTCWTDGGMRANDMVTGVTMSIKFAKQVSRIVESQIAKWEAVYGVEPID